MNTSSTEASAGTAQRRVYAKPFTIAEASARQSGSAYLELALSYHAANDAPNAVSCCLEGLSLIDGISRPLMVRDQLTNLLNCLDPTGKIRTHIQRLANYKQPLSVTPRLAGSQPPPT